MACCLPVQDKATPRKERICHGPVVIPTLAKQIEPRFRVKLPSVVLYAGTTANVGVRSRYRTLLQLYSLLQL